jgi:hypothetical protein
MDSQGKWNQDYHEGVSQMRHYKGWTFNHG